MKLQVKMAVIMVILVKMVMTKMMTMIYGLDDHNVGDNVHPKARLAECEVTVESLNSKLMQLEKSKAQLQVFRMMMIGMTCGTTSDESDVDDY